MRFLSLIGLTVTPILFAGCSLIFDLKTTQCSTDTDCDALGGDFVGLQCNGGLCAGCASNSSCTESRGKGYVCEKPKDKTLNVCKLSSTSQPEPGADAGPDVECNTNQDCKDKHAPKWICRDNACINLVTPECPVVLQAENLTTTDPIIIGAYSAINVGNPEKDPITLDYNLALQDFTTKVGGLSGGPNNMRRGFVAVVCEGRPNMNAPLENSLAHLIDTVKVPGIVASLYTDDLRVAFEQKGHPNHVFFVDPLYADSTLTTQNNDGLLWFILGEYRDLARSYVKLSERAEAYQRAQGASGDLRVAIVQGALTPQKDIAQVLLVDSNNSLKINGKSVLDEANADKNVRLVNVTNDFATNSAAVADAIGSLSSFRPHIVVVTAGNEFLDKVLLPFENSWDDTKDGQVRPFYLLSPDIAAYAKTFTKPAYDGALKRSAGINFAGNADRKLYNAFKINFQATFSGTPFPEESENFYDAMYYLLYAIAAAGNPATLDGDAVALGMQRITFTNGTRFDVGPANIETTLNSFQLSPGMKFNLNGTLGPSDFYPGTGSRVIDGSVWCAKPGQQPVFNVLRLDAAGELTGKFTCFDNF